MDSKDGRPAYTDEQYKGWLSELSPFLKLGNSLSYSIDKAELNKHRSTLYEKYRLGDWFSDKIDGFMKLPGEIVNSIFTRLISSIDEKVKQDKPLTGDDWKNLRFFAEKHRSCQQFFVNRSETAQVEPNKISRILDDLENENIKTDYNLVAKQAGEELKGQETIQDKPI